jgi:ABC-type Fe3+-hydroxamate transport system substrate-binding protein
MKKHRQLLALFICLVMSVSLLTGYSETKAATEEPTQSAEQDATQETAETREITDMAGRKVTVPTAENIEMLENWQDNIGKNAIRMVDSRTGFTKTFNKR